MKLKLLFLLLPFFIFSQNINWESKGELNTNNKYHFETSYDNLRNSFSTLDNNNKGIQISLPINSTNFENFTFYKQNPFSKELNEKFSQIEIFKGESNESNKKAFISIIDQRINITILDDYKKSVLINSKNKNIFVLNSGIKTQEVKASDLIDDIIGDPNTYQKKKL